MFDVHTRHTQMEYRTFEQLNKIHLMCTKYVAVIILRTLEKLISTYSIEVTTCNAICR